MGQCVSVWVGICMIVSLSIYLSGWDSVYLAGCLGVLVSVFVSICPNNLDLSLSIIYYAFYSFLLSFLRNKNGIGFTCSIYKDGFSWFIVTFKVEKSVLKHWYQDIFQKPLKIKHVVGKIQILSKIGEALAL